MELAPDTKTQVLNSQISTYNLLSIPSTNLYLSYAESGSDGSTRRKSGFFDRMEDLFENVIEEDKETINPDDYIVNPLVGMDAISCRIDLSGNLERWYKENKIPIITNLTSDSIPNIDFKTILRDLLGEEIESSPTEIERYVSCPYKFFAESALMAHPRKVYEISSPDVGSILHNLLKI